MSEKPMCARLLCVVAHPDDETIGCGALLASVHDVGIVHITDGAPRDPRFRTDRTLDREGYARVRRLELTGALDAAGILRTRAACLGAVDLEAIGAVEQLCPELARILNETRCTTVLTHPYEGGHPDHDATALIVHAACELLRRQKKTVPEVFEMTSYHGGSGRFTAHAFLPTNDAATGAEGPCTYLLSYEERRIKRAMLDAFVSQREVLAPFGTVLERHRRAPRYRFDRAPHRGRLWYERQGMGSAEAWRRYAIAALTALDLCTSAGAAAE